MRLLFVLANTTYPPAEGAHEQTLALMIALAERGHEVALIAGTKSLGCFDKTAFSRDVPQICLLHVLHTPSSYTGALVKNILRGWAGKWIPGLESRIVCEVRRLSPRFDAVHIEGVSLAPLFTDQLGSAIFSSVDAWSLRQHRLMASELTLVSRFARRVGFVVGWLAERAYFRHYRFVHVVSSRDAAYLMAAHALRNIVQIPVSLHQDGQESLGNVDVAAATSEQILLWGDIRVPYLARGITEFLEVALPKFLECGQPVRFVVISKAAPTGRLARIASTYAERVEILPWVDSLPKLIASVRAVVLTDPTGTGLKNRTVYALASGRAVIGTPSAFEGIDIRNGFDGFCVSGSTQDLAGAVLRLVQRERMLERVGVRGRRFALREFAAESVLEKWERLYERSTT